MKAIEAAIIDLLQRRGPCDLDDIVMYLPELSWGEVSKAIHRMSRKKRVLLRQLSYSTFKIALHP